MTEKEKKQIVPTVLVGCKRKRAYRGRIVVLLLVFLLFYAYSVIFLAEVSLIRPFVRLGLRMCSPNICNKPLLF